MTFKGNWKHRPINVIEIRDYSMLNVKYFGIEMITEYCNDIHVKKHHQIIISDIRDFIKLNVKYL